MPKDTEKLLSQLESQRRKVDFDTYDIIVQQLVTMVESGAIDVAPVYQRQFRWDVEKRSHLIESVFLGLPVPSLFMAANRDGTWELVDGVQRLSTLVQYAGTATGRGALGIVDPLILQGLEKLSEFNGTRFEELPASLQLQFKHRPIKVVTLSDKSDMVVRFDLFERLNTGGVGLTNQEIRACIYRGAFSEFLERLAQNADFRSVVHLTPSQGTDGTREECVLRFFAYLHRYKDFVHSVVDFLNDFMAAATKRFDFQAGEAIFERTFSELARALPRGIVRGAGRRLTPINLFEGVAVGAALALGRKKKLSAGAAAKWLQSAELRRFTTGATNNRPMVVGRIEYCRDRFLGK
ncbi:MAG: DUF262 domain-containing protein [Thermoanaerobaculia bacterium]|nr:DUF262 domain-containing protein [Thermoanaerobaculia bacterium]